jgi:hypothetical protein
MTPNRDYWTPHCAAFSDGHLLRFLDAVTRFGGPYKAAREAAEAEAVRRNLIKEKAAPAGGQVNTGRKQP